jgi:hypothetical protein
MQEKKEDTTDDATEDTTIENTKNKTKKKRAPKKFITSGEINTSFFDEEEFDEQTFNTGTTSRMVHFEVLDNRKNKGLKNIPLDDGVHRQRGGSCCCIRGHQIDHHDFGEREGDNSDDQQCLRCCHHSQTSSRRGAKTSDDELLRKFEDRPVTSLFIIPVLITIQNIWDVIQHCVGLFNNLDPLPHVSIGLFMIVLYHIVVLYYMHLLQTGKSSNNWYVTLSQKRNALWWYFLSSAIVSEIVDLATGTFGIATPHLLVIIAGIASMGQQSFTDEIFLYIYIFGINVFSTIILIAVILILSRVGLVNTIDNGDAMNWHAPYTNFVWTVQKRLESVPAICIFVVSAAWMSYVGHKLHRQERKIRLRVSKLTKTWKSRLEFTDTVLGTSLPEQIVKRIDMASSSKVYVGIADHCSQASVSFIKLCGISEAFRSYSTVEAVGLLGKIYKQMVSALEEKILCNALTVLHYFLIESSFCFFFFGYTPLFFYLFAISFHVGSFN